MANRSSTHRGPGSTRPSFLLLSVGTLLLSIACSSAPRKPPTAPMKQATKQNEQQEELEKMQRRHVAPPPAYGNKVVTAQACIPAKKTVF